MSDSPQAATKSPATQRRSTARGHASVIGLVEDDPLSAEIVSAWLQAAGYKVRVFTSDRQFRRNLGSESVDCIVLDWILPDGNGIDLLRRLRGDLGSDLPVIFLTGKDSSADIVAALDAGADDYLIKPANGPELIARIRSIMRRRNPTSREALDCAPFAFDLKRRVACWPERAIEVGGREFELMLYLFRRAGRIISREALLADVWNVGPSVNTRSLDTYASRLRKKMGLQGESGWRLDAIYQHGYRLLKLEPSEPSSSSGP